MMPIHVRIMYRVSALEPSSPYVEPGPKVMNPAQSW